MKCRFLLLAGALMLEFAESAPTTLPVCIVGAGPAGLIAANKLEAQGRKVVLFEKQNSVGGKNQAFYERNIYHPLGALLFSNATYTETLKIVEISGVRAIPFVTGQRWLYNWTSGVTGPSPAISSAFATLVGQEFQRYTAYWYSIFAPYSGIGYKKGVPQEFTVSTAQWLATNNFQALPVLFVQAMVAFGYGDLRQVPILYMLQYLTPDILGFFASVHQVYLIDFHKVFVRFAKTSIKGPILLGSSITEIDRSGSHPIIRYRTEDHKDGRNQQGQKIQKQDCSSLIIAFPPTLSALKAANLKLSENEETVFTPMGLIDYFSGAVRLSTPRDLTFSAASAAPNIPTDAAGQPVSFLYLFNTSNIATSWSWGPYRGNGTVEAAKTILKETLSRINKDPRDPAAVPKPVTDKDVVAFKKHDYFPHFDSQQLADGWYGKFNALQGQKNTYYASGLNGFETIEFALRAGLDVVESYF